MTQEYYARVDSKYQGNTIFSVPFPYLHKKDINVYINNNLTTNYTWLNASQIDISATMQTGDDVSIRRITPILEKEVTFSNDSILDKDAQNKQHDQVLYSVQELHDDFGVSLIELIAINKKTEELAEEAQEILEETEDVLEEAQAAVDRAEQYADSAEFGMKWISFTTSNWVEGLDGKYTLTLNDVPLVNAIYKGTFSNKKLIKNCDIKVSETSCVITSMEAFDGFALTSSSVLGLYTHEQTLASDEWIIDHNTGHYPCVTIVDNNNIVMVGTIQYVTLNRVKVTFESAVTGKAFLR